MFLCYGRHQIAYFPKVKQICFTCSAQVVDSGRSWSTNVCVIAYREMPNDKQPTLADVARQAGVSTATVSRCLNSPDKVREDLRGQVSAAIAELGYVPSGAARALASKRTGTVGAVIPTLDSAIFARGIQSLQKRLSRSGYRLLLASSDYAVEQEAEEVRALVLGGVDGLVLVGTDHDPEIYRLLQSRNIPFVHTWTYGSEDKYPCVGFDNRDGAYRITRYLLDLGHREFAVIAGITHNNNRATERVRGIREGLSSAGIELPASRVLERPYSLAAGREALTQCMAWEHVPTAVLCANDILAIGALFGAQTMGISVPFELSITGYDNLPIASQVPPGLTTIDVPAGEMGQLAADYLISRIQGGAAPERTELAADVVLRGTTAPPAGRSS